MAGKKGALHKKLKEDSQKYKEYYQNNFPELTEQQCEEKANWFKKSCNWQCIEYYEKKYPNLSHEEHIKLREQNLNKKKYNDPVKIEYWKKLYPEKSIEELESLRKQYSKEHNYQCIEFYQRKYPNLSSEEQEKMLKENISKAGKKIGEKVSGEKNGMHKSKASQQKRNENSPFNIEFYKKRGMSEEDFIKFHKETNKKITFNTTLEYYLKRGLNEEEAKLALKERQQTFTLEKCIEKYGEEKGLELFKERQHKWLKSLYKSFNENGDSRSPQSKFARKIISELCKKLNIDYPKKEKFIYDSELKIPYCYDFCFNKKIIEFNGDYWHCNPLIYEETFYNKNKRKTAKEICQYDFNKFF